MPSSKATPPLACRSDGALFLILYGITAVYFSGVMVGAQALLRVAFPGSDTSLPWQAAPHSMMRGGRCCPVACFFLRASAWQLSSCVNVKPASWPTAEIHPIQPWPTVYAPLSLQVRLMLVLAPATCCLAAVAISDLLYTCCGSLKHSIRTVREHLPVPGWCFESSSQHRRVCRQAGTVGEGIGSAQHGVMGVRPP